MKIEIAGIIEEDFVNYKVPSMTIMMPHCNGKCNKDAGKIVCQNWHLTNSHILEFEINFLVQRYLNNSITSAVVFQGLEPFDDFEKILEFIKVLRIESRDTVVIYTGYKEEEVKSQIAILSNYENIIIKFGRFNPDQALFTSPTDPILGVKLATANQYGKRIS